MNEVSFLVTVTAPGAGLQQGPGSDGLPGGEDERPRRLLHGFGQVRYRAVGQAHRLAVFDAGGRLAALDPLRTEVAEPCDERDKVHVDLIRPNRDHLVHPDAAHAPGEVVLLLAGDLTGMTSGAPFVSNQEAVAGHGW